MGRGTSNQAVAHRLGMMYGRSRRAIRLDPSRPHRDYSTSFLHALLAHNDDEIIAYGAHLVSHDQIKDLFLAVREVGAQNCQSRAVHMISDSLIDRLSDEDESLLLGGSYDPIAFCSRVMHMGLNPMTVLSDVRKTLKQQNRLGVLPATDLETFSSQVRTDARVVIAKHVANYWVEDQFACLANLEDALYYAEDLELVHTPELERAALRMVLKVQTGVSDIAVVIDLRSSLAVLVKDATDPALR
jgi:hypothetical protein